MKNTFLTIVILLIACAPKVTTNQPALGYSFLPPKLELDTIGPKITPNLDPSTDTTLKDYSAIAVMPGKLITKTDSMYLPQGTLFSDKKTAMYIFYRAEYDRLSTELSYSGYLLDQYYDASKAAEILYQKRIEDLTQSNKRSWIETNACYIGMLLGIVSTITTEYFVVKVSK
jgi:hypothetical protein